ncbi:MAG: radical SAM protein [Planctomycetota bacterium]|jgi:radical SAM protein with 4Fe4S-binding SPASM domain
MNALQQLKERNSRRLAEDVAQRRLVFRGMPQYVSLHTIDECNLRCIMCPRSFRPGRGKLGRATLARVCGELFPTLRRAIVAGHHGEPTMGDFDLIEAAALEYGVNLDVTTNGTLIDGEWYRRTRKALGVLSISLDSHIPEVYERIRVGSRWDRILRKLRSIAAVRASEPDDVIWTVSAVVMRSNINHLPEFVAFAAGLGVDAVTFQPLRQFERSIPEEDVLGGGQHDYHRGVASACPSPLATESRAKAYLLRQLDVAREAGRQHGVNIYTGDFQLPSLEVRPLSERVHGMSEATEFCRPLTQSLAIYHTGDGYPCCHPTDHIAGNVDRDSIRTIWNSRAMQNLRRAHFEAIGTLFCTGCIHAPYLGERSMSRVVDGVKTSRLAYQHCKSIATRGVRRAFKRAFKRAGTCAQRGRPCVGIGRPCVRSEVELTGLVPMSAAPTVQACEFARPQTRGATLPTSPQATSSFDIGTTLQPSKRRSPGKRRRILPFMMPAVFIPSTIFTSADTASRTVSAAESQPRTITAS